MDPAAATLRATFALVALAAPALAQDELKRVAVHVTAVEGSRAYLDQGSDAGLAAGDRVELHPDGRPLLEASVRGVTRNSARIEWTGNATLDVGTAGEALIPLDRPPPSAVDHPPWAAAAEKFDPAAPLLAPVHGVDNWKRPRDLRGRWTNQVGWNSIDVNGTQDYLLASTGLDVSLDNPFGKGGALEFDGEIFHRTQSTWDSGSEARTNARLDRLSTWWGGVRGRETRMEVGRFLQHEFPEFGVLDGGEVTWRTSGGDRFGASAGLLPQTDAVRSEGADTAVSAYYRHVVGEDEHAALGAGIQKTWHRGSPDRDLAVVNGHWRSGARWSIYGSTWIDVYGAEDKAKSSGAELTQAFANVNYRFDSGLALGVHASQFRWPDLARNELPPATAATLADGVVTRVGIDGSKALTQRLRLWARADHWTDQDDDGGNYELRASLRDTLFARGEVSASLFATQGKFSDWTGVRLGLQRNFDLGACRLDYEVGQADQRDFNGAQSSLTQHAVRASLDTAFGRGWTLSLSGESRFGDEQGSIAAMFFLQHSF